MYVSQLAYASACRLPLSWQAACVQGLMMPGALLLASMTGVLRAPTLQINASRSLTVCWDAPDDAADHYYQLQMSVEREGRPTFHMTKRARAGEHSLLWSDLPDHADCCFRVARIAGAADALGPTSLPLAAYSEPTCYSSCTCMGGDAGGGDDEGGGSCFSCALMGAVLGSLLALVGAAYFSSRGGLDACPKQLASVARGFGGAYSHLTTAEPGMEMDEHARAHSTNYTSHLPAASGRGGSAGLGGGGEIGITPPPEINAAEFEQRWSACSTRSLALSGRLPSTTANQVASDEAEAALGSRGFFCVAAGGVGEVHKLYFAGEVSARLPTRIHTQTPTVLTCSV